MLRRITCSAIMVVTMVPCAAIAGTWQSSIKLPLSVEYAENPALSIGGDTAVWRARFSPQYGLTRFAGRDTVYGEAALLVERAEASDESTDRTDRRATLGWQRRLLRGNVSVSAEYDLTTMRVTESDEVGIRGSDSEREGKSAVCTWDYALTQRTNLELAGGYRAVSYDNEGFRDFDQYSAELKIDSAVHPRLSFSGGVGIEQHRPVRASSEDSDLYSVQLGMSSKVTERMDWDFVSRGYRTQSDEAESGWGGSSILSYALQNGKASLTADRTLTTNTGRGLTEADTLAASVTISIDELTLAGITVEHRKLRSTTAEESNSSFSVLARRRLSRAWEIAGKFRWLIHDVSGSGEARGYILGLNLTYSRP